MHVSAGYISSLGYLKKKEPEKASAAEYSLPSHCEQRTDTAGPPESTWVPGRIPVLRVLWTPHSQEELQKKSQLCISSSFSLCGAGASTE